VPACSQIAGANFFTGITNTIWYKFTPASSGVINDVDTIGSSYDTVLSIWTGTSSSLTAFACDDDIVSGIDIQSQLTSLGVAAGTTYYIMVSSFGPADPNPIALGGESILNFQFTSNAALPSISSLTPNSGPIGTSVTIAGSNFGATQSTSTVTFNGTAATPTTWSASSIVVIVPAGAITGSVVVTVGGVASNGMTFTVTATGNFTVAENAVTLSSATGTAVNSTVTVTPSGGFTGTVGVTAGTSTPGVTCTPSPLNIVVPGAAPVTGTLRCSVLATSSTLTASNAQEDGMLAAKATSHTMPGKAWWTLSAGTGVAALFLLFLPSGRKKYRAALGLGLVCILSLILGCNSGSSTPPPPPPTQTTTKLTATVGKVPTGTAFTFNVAVTGGTPTGQVELFDNGTMIGTAASVSGGAAAPVAPALAVGTHQISAHYLGDSTTAASQSGSLNLTVTGTTTVTITTNPAATPVAPALSVTIN
jgi:hypothetical protein